MRKALRGNWAVLTANLIGFFLIFAAILKLLQLTDLTWYVSATAFDSLIAKIGIVLDLSFAALLLSGLWRKKSSPVDRFFVRSICLRKPDLSVVKSKLWMLWQMDTRFFHDDCFG